MGQLIDHIRSYYESLNTGDPDRVAAHFTDDATHYYTRLARREDARTTGEHTKWGVDSIAGQWHIDNAMEEGERAVSEWAMPGRDPRRGEPRLDRGTEWFAFAED